MNGCGAVHGDVRDDFALDERHEQRCEPGLHDVAAEHHDYGALLPRGVHDGVDDVTKVARDENVQERREEGVK